MASASAAVATESTGAASVADENANGKVGPAKAMTPEERAKWRELKKQLRLSSRGKTNAAVIQMLANMCRSEEGICDKNTYKTKKEEQKTENTAGRDITFWQRRFIKTNASEQKVEDSNLFTKYANQKFQPGEGEKKELTFSENIQDVLLKMTAQFGNQINVAYDTDPATEAMKKSNENPLSAITKMHQIDENMKAIDTDMQILKQKKEEGHVTATQFFEGFAELGEDDYLSESDSDGSSSDSDDDDDSDNDDSDEDSDDDSDEDEDDDDSDSDNSSLDSYGSLFLDMQNRMGMDGAPPGLQQSQQDDMVDMEKVRSMAFAGQQAPPNAQLPAGPAGLAPTLPTGTQQPSVAPKLAGLKPPPPDLDDDSDSDDDDDSDDSDDDDSDDSDDDDDSDLDSQFLDQMAAKMGMQQAPPQAAAPPPPPNPLAALMGGGGPPGAGGGPPVNPLAALMGVSPPPPPPPVEEEKKEAATGEEEEKPPSAEVWAAYGVGMDVGAFNKKGRPNDKAAKQKRSKSSNFMISQANDADTTSALNIAAQCAALHDEEMQPFALHNSGGSFRTTHKHRQLKHTIDNADDLDESVLAADRDMFVSFSDYEDSDAEEDVSSEEELKKRHAAVSKVNVRDLKGVTVDRKWERTSLLVSCEECHCLVEHLGEVKNIEMKDSLSTDSGAETESKGSEHEHPEHSSSGDLTEHRKEPSLKNLFEVPKPDSSNNPPVEKKTSLVVGFGESGDDDDSNLLVDWGEKLTDSDDDKSRFKVKAWCDAKGHESKGFTLSLSKSSIGSMYSEADPESPPSPNGGHGRRRRGSNGLGKKPSGRDVRGVKSRKERSERLSRRSGNEDASDMNKEGKSPSPPMKKRSSYSRSKSRRGKSREAGGSSQHHSSTHRRSSRRVTSSGSDQRLSSDSPDHEEQRSKQRDRHPPKGASHDLNHHGASRSKSRHDDRSRSIGRTRSRRTSMGGSSDLHHGPSRSKNHHTDQSHSPGRTQRRRASMGGSHDVHHKPLRSKNHHHNDIHLRDPTPTRRPRRRRTMDHVSTEHQPDNVSPIRPHTRPHNSSPSHHEREKHGHGPTRTSSAGALVRSKSSSRTKESDHHRRDRRSSHHRSRGNERNRSRSGRPEKIESQESLGGFKNAFGDIPDEKEDHPKQLPPPPPKDGNCEAKISFPSLELVNKKSRKKKKKNSDENSLDTRRRRKIRQGLKKKENEEYVGGLRLINKRHGAEVGADILHKT